MKLLVYRDKRGFVFGPAENKKLIEEKVKEQEWCIDDQPDLVEQLGKYQLVGEIEGDVFYAWIKGDIAFIESDKTKIEENGYKKYELKVLYEKPLIKKTYQFLGMTFTYEEARE